MRTSVLTGLRAARLLTLTALAVGPLASGASAWAADSNAPPGAPAHWLPADRWVQERLLPFDESRLHELLGTDAVELRAWLGDESRTVEDLARARGVARVGLAERLVGGAAGPRRGVLISRTRQVLTQPHLAQHLFTHVFHHREVLRAAPRIFGVDKRAWRNLRSRERMTIAEIARRRDVPLRLARGRFLAATDASLAAARNRGDIDPVTQAAQRAEYRATIDHWMATQRADGKPGAGDSGPGLVCAI